jgi:hypothetical protein
MTTPDDPERNQSSEGVDLSKGESAADAPFDPYRFGKPDHPIPAEYAPPGYTGPVIPAQPPAPPWGAPPGMAPGNPFSNPPGTPYAPYGTDPGAQQPGPYPPPPGQYPQYGPPPGYYPPTPQYGYSPRPVAGGNGKAVAALVLGIGSIVFCWLIFFDAALVIPGIIFSLLALSEAKARGAGRGMALAGLVCSIVGAALATVLTVLIVHAANQCGGFNNSNEPGFNHCVRDNFF